MEKNSSSLQPFFKFLNQYVVALFLGFLIIGFSIISSSFLNTENLLFLVTHNSPLIIMAVGLSFIMVGGGIDLSLGYQISLCSVVMGYLLANDTHPLAAMAFALLTGVACGALNAAVIVSLKIPPFAATLATQFIFRAVANTISSGRAYTRLPQIEKWNVLKPFLGITIHTWIAIICLIFYGLVFSLTPFGTYVKALGENESAVKRIGIRVNKVKVVSYITGSFFFAIQAIILTSLNGIASPTTGVGLEIVAITVVFLGCNSLLRNESTNVIGPMFHLVLGVMILAVLENGMLLAGWSINTQLLVRGFVLILAITLYYRRKTYLSHDETT
jgi:ribose/xylose/arabinose/galactoside ABC-type transport system permease subunit